MKDVRVHFSPFSICDIWKMMATKGLGLFFSALFLPIWLPIFFAYWVIKFTWNMLNEAWENAGFECKVVIAVAAICYVIYIIF